MSLRRRLAVAGSMIAVLFSAGTLGIHLAEGTGWFDSLYQTVVTVSTAGIAGAQVRTIGGKLLTIALLVLGGGILFYCIGTVVQLALEGQMARYFGGQRMRSRIDSLRGHFIVCGYGRVGEEVGEEFKRHGVEFVVIESAPEIARRVIERGGLVVEADATEDAALIAAGIRHARCLVAVSNSDANNTYITLSAKALNPAIFVVARTGAAGTERKLTQAGADRVVSPYRIAGRHIALSAIQPSILDAGATPSETSSGLMLAQISVGEGSDHHGRTVGKILQHCPRTVALGLHLATGTLLPSPGTQQLVSAGDELIVFGPEAELEQITPSSLKAV